MLQSWILVVCYSNICKKYNDIHNFPLHRQVRQGVSTIRCREIKAAAMDRQRRVIKMVSRKH